MEEKKTYLVNVESNLEKYAQEAADAKKKVDELAKANQELKESGKASAAEIEASNSSLRSAQKEYNQAKKLVDLQTQANNSNVNSRKQLDAIVKIEQQRLGALANQYTINAKGQRVLSDEYLKAVKNLKDAKDAVIAYDKAQSDGRSNIGRYGEAAKEAFVEAGKGWASMLTGAAAAGVAITVVKKIFDGMKDAIMSTTYAIDLMNKGTAITKQLYYDLAINGQINIDNLKKASEVQDQFNKLRIKDAIETVELSKLNREEQEVRELSIDRTRTHAQRLQDLNKVQELESEKTKIKIENLKEELHGYQELHKIQPANEEIMLKILELKGKINDTYAEEDQAMRRVQTQRTTFLQEQIDERKDMIKKWYDEIDRNTEAGLKLMKLNAGSDPEKLKLALKAEYEYKIQNEKLTNNELLVLKKEYENSVAEIDNKTLEEFKKKLKGIENEITIFYNKTLSDKKGVKSDELRFNEKYYDDQKKQIEYAKWLDQWETDQYIYNQELKQQAAIDSLSTISTILGEQTEAGKMFAAAAATIDTFGAANKALNDPTIPSTMARILLMSSILLKGFANIRQIYAVKPGKSSSVSTPSPVAITTPKITAQPVTNIFNQPQLSQPQLNAISNQGVTSENLVKALEAMPAPVTYIEDIERVTKRTNKIKTRANI